MSNTQKPVDVLLFIEHVARELDIACAVKHLLEKKHNLSLEIASINYGLEETLKAYQPGVIAVPYCYSAYDVGINNILQQWPNAIYLNLAYEQVFQKINQTFKSPKDVFAKKYVIHHAWGNFFVNYLEQFGVTRENVVVNGNPSYMLYQSPYCHFFDSRSKLAERHGLDTGKPWLFIPENYGAAFYTDRMIWQRIFSGTSPVEAFHYRRFALESLRQVLRWLIEAAKQRQVEIIVRPRPATSLEAFNQILKDIGLDVGDNLHVIKDGSVREWILASDIIASSYSTTIIEAAVARKPIYMLMPIQFPDYLYADWYDLVPRIKDLSSLLSAIDSLNTLPNWRNLQEWAEKSMLSQGDIIENIASLMAYLLENDASKPNIQGIDSLIIRKPISLFLSNNRHKRMYQLQRGRQRAAAAASWRLERILNRGVPQNDQNNQHDQDLFDKLNIQRKVAEWAAVIS